MSVLAPTGGASSKDFEIGWKPSNDAAVSLQKGQRTSNPRSLQGNLRNPPCQSLKESLVTLMNRIQRSRLYWSWELDLTIVTTPWPVPKILVLFFTSPNKANAHSVRPLTYCDQEMRLLRLGFSDMENFLFSYQRHNTRAKIRAVENR